MPSFTIQTPSEPWKLVLIPTTDATMGDEIIIMPSRTPFGSSVEPLPTGQMKVSVSAFLAARMKRGSWSAVAASTIRDKILAVHCDIMTIEDTHEGNDLHELLKAFAATLEPIEFPMLGN